MNKGRIIINFEGFKIIEKTASRFGNGAHVVLPKEYGNKLLKIIIGKEFKTDKKEIELNFFGNEILERKANKFGTSFHITVPKEYSGKKVRIIYGGKNE